MSTLRKTTILLVVAFMAASMTTTFSKSVHATSNSADPIAVYVGYADNLRASPFFPVPWAGDPNVIFIGGGTFDAGAIRIDNTGGSPVTVNSVSVTLHGPSSCIPFGNPCGPLNLWGTGLVIPPGFHLILTQTASFNFDTSDNPISSCGVPVANGTTPLPIITVTIGGVPHQFNDTAHVLDTLGYDLACQGNESEQWRPIGTFGGNPEVTLTPSTATSMVGTPHTVTATVIDNVTGQPVPNTTVNFSVSGANTASGSCVTVTIGNIATCTFTYTGTNAGTDTITGSATVRGVLVTSPPVHKIWTSIFDFSLSPNPKSSTVLRGGNASYLINLTLASGNAQPVTLSILSGLPSGATTTFTPNPISPPGTSKLVISSSLTGGLGDFNVTVLGQSGPVSHTLSVLLHVYDFTVTSSLCQQTVLRGGIAPFNLTLALVPGSSIVNLPPISIQVSGLPPNTTVAQRLSDGTITSALPIVVNLSSSPVTVQLLIQTNSSTPLGDFPFSISGVDTRSPEGGSRPVSNCGGRATINTVNMPITFNCSQTLVSGASTICNINVTLVSGPVTFQLLPMTFNFSGICGFSLCGVHSICTPQSGVPPFTAICMLTFPPGFSGNLTLSGFIGSSPGFIGGTVRGSPPGGQPGQALVLHIYDFQVIVSPQQTVLRGGIAVYNVTVALLPGSSTVGLPTIYLSLSGLPPGVTASLNPSNGTALGFTSILTIQTSNNTLLGDFSFNVTGTDIRPLLGGSRVGSGILHVYDFTTTSSPASSFATVGGAAFYNETLRLLPSSSTIGLPQIQLSVMGLPAGTVATFNPASVIPSLAGSITIFTIQPSAAGTFSLTIIGTDTRIPQGGSRSSLPQSPQTLIALPQNSLTDTSYCPFDVDSSLSGQQFRLIFTPNPSSASTFELTASNPGQFYYNGFFAGVPSSTVMLKVQIPYPFVTQGAVPIQVYSSVGFSGPCFIPMNIITPGFGITGGGTFTSSGAPQIILTDYNPQLFGSMVIVTVTGQIPSSGLVYVTIHLNYGLKGTIGYGNDLNNDAVNATSGVVLIPNLEAYSFSQTGSSTNGIHLSATVTVQSENVFKKDPGIAGLVLDQNGTPVPGVMVQIYDSSGHLLAAVYTDKDGWYMWSYKYTGKPATFTVSLPSYGQSQSLTLKSNGFVEANFTVKTS